MLVTFREFISRKKLRLDLYKIIDGFFTFLGMSLIVIFLLVSLPFFILDQWLAGGG